MKSARGKGLGRVGEVENSRALADIDVMWLSLVGSGSQ